MLRLPAELLHFGKAVVFVHLMGAPHRQDCACAVSRPPGPALVTKNPISKDSRQKAKREEWRIVLQPRHQYVRLVGQHKSCWNAIEAP